MKTITLILLLSLLDSPISASVALCEELSLSKKKEKIVQISQKINDTIHNDSIKLLYYRKRASLLKDNPELLNSAKKAIEFAIRTRQFDEAAEIVLYSINAICFNLNKFDEGLALLNKVLGHKVHFKDTELLGKITCKKISFVRFFGTRY